ncbi:unnamed protein product [marine sediment metagenome]|uniref:Uncharacterized protein n=1 Tax=marine sediment metagenome TaxID=412755 RepID=X1V9R0_9ZZZZ
MNKEILQAERIRAYAEFMVDFYQGLGKAIVAGRKKQADQRVILEWAKRIRMFNARCTMIASDDVIKALIEYDKVAREAMLSQDMPIVLAQFAKVAVIMRKDLNPGTLVTELEILRTIVTDVDSQPRLLELLS